MLELFADLHKQALQEYKLHSPLGMSASSDTTPASPTKGPPVPPFSAGRGISQHCLTPGILDAPLALLCCRNTLPLEL